MFGLENFNMSNLNPFNWYEKYKEVKQDISNIQELAREAGQIKEKVEGFIGKAGKQTEGVWGNLETIKEKVCEFFGSEWMGRSIIPLAIGAILAVGAAWFGLSKKTDSVAQNTFKNTANGVGQARGRRSRKKGRLRPTDTQLSPEQVQRKAAKKRARQAKKLNFTQLDRVKAYLDHVESEGTVKDELERTHLHLAMASRASKQVDRLHQRLKLAGADRDAALFDAGLIQESLEALSSDPRLTPLAKQQFAEIHKRLERLVTRAFEVDVAQAGQVYQQEQKFRSEICKKYQLTHVPVPGDGNCLFSSALKEIQRTHPERYLALVEKAQTGDFRALAKVYRKEVFGHIEKNLHSGYKEQLEASLQDQAEEVATADKTQLERLLRRLPDGLAVRFVNLRAIYQTEGRQKFQAALENWILANGVREYINGMKNSRAYAGPLELQAIAELEKQSIRVFTNQFDGEFLDVVGKGKGYQADKTLHLYRPRGVAHYDALQPQG